LLRAAVPILVPRAMRGRDVTAAIKPWTQRR
jgi:hypothetical protein